MPVRLKYLIVHVKYLKLYPDIAHHKQFNKLTVMVVVIFDLILRSSPVYIASTSTPLSFDHPPPERHQLHRPISIVFFLGVRVSHSDLFLSSNRLVSRLKALCTRVICDQSSSIHYYVTRRYMDWTGVNWRLLCTKRTYTVDEY